MAANLLADEGWDVVVVETAPGPGGAVRSGELTLPGWTHDRFSAFYPFAAASPVVRGLGLEEWGLRWRHSPHVLAHPFDDGTCAVLSRDLATTAASLDALRAGDGEAWRSLYATWERAGTAIVDAITSPLPPVRPALRMGRAIGLRRVPSFARFALQSAQTIARERFRGPGGGALLVGNALHTDLSPGSPPSGAIAWVLACLGQEVGWPAAEGGAGRITRALVDRLAARGGVVRCGQRVVKVEVRAGRAVAVETADGTTYDAVRAVVATTGAPALFLELLDPEHVPARVRRRMMRFEYDQSTVKVDWALDRPIPWVAEGARASAGLHVAGSTEEMVRYAAELGAGLVPERPYLVMGQMTLADPTRSPAGTETAWAYTHLPQSRADADADEVADRMEAQIERFAPGFRSAILARHVASPAALERANANLVGGAVGGGSSRLRQQLLLRPGPRLARGITPVEGLFLGSASIHPGGGVHGAPGATAAGAALAAWRRRQRRSA